MEEKDLNSQVERVCNLFIRIVIFALFGWVFAFALNLDPILGYKLIISAGILGTTISIHDVIKDMTKQE